MMARRSILATALVALVARAHAGIYPADHFDFATKLTVESMESHVKTEVDAGRTLLAGRTIAPPPLHLLGLRVCACACV
jgi:hypothetical protein